MGSSDPQTSVAISTGLFRRYLNPGFRIIVVVLLLSALVFELSSNRSLPFIWDAFFTGMRHSNQSWIWLALLLMPLNWLAETAKWHFFIRRLEQMSWRKAYAAILTGVSFALFTPNRLGEFGGRLLYVKPANHWTAFLANLAGSLAQLLVLLSCGIAGTLWFLTHFGYLTQWALPLALVSIVATVILYAAFFNISVIRKQFKKVAFLRWIGKKMPDFTALEKIKRTELAVLLLWSAIRYLIYSTQYLFILYFLDIFPGIRPAYAGISLIFLLQTALPLPSLAALLVRGNLAVLVWSFFGANEISSLAATFILWIINLILPALLGSAFIFNVRISKTLGYEDL